LIVRPKYQIAAGYDDTVVDGWIVSVTLGSWELQTVSRNKLNMKKEIWTEIGKSDTFSTTCMLK
jgi:hypothetical protein